MKYWLAYIFVLVLFSCKKENMFDCLKPFGSVETETRTVSVFNQIVISSKVNVYLKQDNYYEVSVKAGKNMLSNIHTEAANGVLTIKDKNTCNFVRDPKNHIDIYITAPHFKYIKQLGEGTVYCVNTIQEDTLIIRIEASGDVHMDINTHLFDGSTHGNGDCYVSGTTDYFYYNYNGTNFIYASGLNVHSYIYLESHSVGHAYVNANNIGMDAALFTDGNIYYTGTPAFMHYTSRGKGSVIKE